MKSETYYKMPLKKLYKLAEEYFHKYIVIRDRKKRKHCITCMRGVEEAGHFNHGGNRGMSFWVDFSKKNLNGQCHQCNYYYSGKLNIYSEELIKIYGSEIVEELNTLTWKSEVWGHEDLIKIIEFCKKYLKANQ